MSVIVQVFGNPNNALLSVQRYLSYIKYAHEPKYKLPTVSINKPGNGNCVKSRKFIANRTNEYFILTCITSYVWKSEGVNEINIMPLGERVCSCNFHFLKKMYK